MAPTRRAHDMSRRPRGGVLPSSSVRSVSAPTRPVKQSPRFGGDTAYREVVLLNGVYAPVAQTAASERRAVNLTSPTWLALTLEPLGTSWRILQP